MCFMSGCSDTHTVLSCSFPTPSYGFAATSRQKPWEAVKTLMTSSTIAPLPAAVPSHSSFSWASTSARLMYRSCRAHPLFHTAHYKFHCACETHKRKHAHTHLRNVRISINTVLLPSNLLFNLQPLVFLQSGLIHRSVWHHPYRRKSLDGINIEFPTDEDQP